MKSLATIAIAIAVLIGVGCSQRQPLMHAANNLRAPATPIVSPTVGRLAEPNLIDPGKRIGPVSLGTDFDAAFSILGKPFFDHSYKPPVCSAREVQWIIQRPNEEEAVLVARSSSDDTIDLLRSDWAGYETAEGVKNGDSLKAFMSKYNLSTSETYADRGIRRNPKYVEGYSAYIVDQDRGIAFEFVKSRKGGVWLINTISVFYPRTDFSEFRYCGNPEKDKWWIKLKSLSLDSAPELK